MFLSNTIKEHRSAGMSYHKIADWMNQRGYLTPRGKPFSATHAFSIEKKIGLRNKRLFGAHKGMCV
jgi:hypothetical protein